MDQALLAFRWYLVVHLFGLAALPLCLRLFRHLPDRGYGVSKPLGLLLAGWAFWFLTTFGCLHNTAGGILVALALLVVAGLALYHRVSRIEYPRSGFILASEFLFALAFAVWCGVRAHMPRIETAGGEKWMEIAFLRAILRSDTFPPHDPWLSGFAISYYYFGYVIVAMLTRLAAVPPSIAFNLGIATLFALTCAGAFSLVYNLIASEGKTAEVVEGKWREGSAIFGGLLGPLLVAVMGNLGGLLEMLDACGVGSTSFWRWLDVRNLAEVSSPLSGRFFWWWNASRVIHDYTPWGADQEVIDEFPAFSFLLGDMHPHVLGLPFVLLALALAFNLYRRTVLQPETWDLKLFHWTISFPLRPWELFVYALCLGGLGFLNTWDFPIYLFVVTVAYILADLRSVRHRPRLTVIASRFALLFVGLFVIGLLLYFPFWRSFQSQAGGILLNVYNGTRLTQFLVMFGPLVFLLAAFGGSQAGRTGVQAGQVARWTLGVTMIILTALLLVLGIVVSLVWLGVIPEQGAVSYVGAWLRHEPIPGLEERVPGLLGLMQHRFLLDPEVLNPMLDVPRWIVTLRSILASSIWTTLGLVAGVVTVVLILKGATSDQQSATSIRDFILLLFATGALLALSVEYVYLKDHFGTRMNTVFKFYFQAWVMWGVAGAYALATFVRWGRVGVVVVAGLLIAAGLVYPVLAIPKRAGEHGGLPTLDGAAYLVQTHPDDYAAIAWLNENVEGAPVILEAPGGAYDYESRVSAHTGLPTLLGWAGHEGQWRGNFEEQNRRGPDIEVLYASVEPGEVLTLLDKYGISYVYVGPVERARYPAAGLAKFAELMDVVYEAGAVTIYCYRHDMQATATR
jgi:YYY domain-containing protein